MEVSKLIYFLSFSIMLTLVPGPDMLFVVTQSISQGKKAGITTAMGLSTGVLVHSTAAAIGISAILHESVVAYKVLKYAGGLYLLFLAWKAFKERNCSLVEAESYEIGDMLSLYRKGIVMNVLNPKVALFFLALLPQFVTKGSFSVPIQMIILGVIFMIQSMVIFFIISIFSEMLRNSLLNKPNISKKINLVKTGVFALIGVTFFFSK